MTAELKGLTSDLLIVDQLKVAVTPGLVGQINSVMTDPKMRDYQISFNCTNKLTR